MSKDTNTEFQENTSPNYFTSANEYLNFFKNIKGKAQLLKKGKLPIVEEKNESL